MSHTGVVIFLPVDIISLQNLSFPRLGDDRLGQSAPRGQQKLGRDAVVYLS
ncbi:hypothetical protein [Gemmobacter caeni]|uniref:hypothetical protein n=1 Tax=Gemmobacter caeni TaxID=589035 RepID=UPI001B881369|nr:hypothetical protein [Gemmobacter caeni]